MKKFVTITALLMAALMVCSCGGSGGSEGDNAPVKVSFILDTPNSEIAKIATVDASSATYDFYYAAVPQWTGSDFANPQGATSAYGTDANPTYKKINNYTAGSQETIGYFAQGTWKFYAQVKKKNTEVVVYEGSTGVEYINASKSVVINVTRKAQAGTATVSVDIEVPIVSAGTVLTVDYGTAISLTKTTMDSASNKPTHGAGWARFKGTSAAIQAGSYTFTITSKTAADGTAVGGAILAFDIVPGENRTITGTIENGVWQTTVLTINVPTLTVEVTGSPTATVGTPTTYTCTATSAQLEEGDEIEYQWYVGKDIAPAVSPAVSTGSTYAFTPAAPGYYYVTCKAYVSGKLIGSKTLAVTANPAS